MAKMTISRQRYELETDKELVHYIQNGVVIGTARHTNGFAMEELAVYQNDVPKYSLKEVDRVFWVFYHCLYLISFALQLFLAPRYKIYEGEEMVGASLEPHTKPARTFRIHQDEYRLFLHAENRFSLTKNGVQIALYTKRPEASILRAAPPWPTHTYDVLYEKGEQMDVIRLFCLFIDKRFFLKYNGLSHQKYIVPRDPYSHHTLWQPKE